jgi:hypothetical protein
LLVATDARNNIYEHEGEADNSKYSFININIPPPSDLLVGTIQSPAHAFAGQPVKIDYTIRNKGLNPATGIMSDGIYLSKDEKWDIGDQLIGTVNGTINLAPNGEITRSLISEVTGASVGSYKVIVKTDLLNNITETNDANNTGAGIDSIKIDVKELLLTISAKDTLKNNTYLYYRIEIPDSLAGETLLATLKSDSTLASNELYIKAGSVPSRSVYDFNYGTTSGENQEVLIPALHGGTYYLAAFGSNETSARQSITLNASILPFAIRAIESNKGGNTGSVTVEIRGSKFEPNMQIRLDNGTGASTPATNVYYVNSTRLFASFDLRNQPLGLYNVTARKTNNAFTVLDKGFEIVAGSGGGFYISGNNTTAEPGCDPGATGGLNSLVQVSVQHPPASRRNRVVAITIFFGNAGNVDLPIPTRFIFSKYGAPLSFTVDGLIENLQELPIEFKETNGPPNVLRPGATGAVTVYTKAVAPMNFILSD